LNISTLTKAYLRGLSYFLLSPFPWNIATGNQLVAYPQMVLWYFLLFFAAVGVSEGLRFSRDETVFIVLFILIGVSLWAMTEGNIGAAFRHRDYFSFLIFIYSSAGILNLVGRSRSIKQGTVRT